MKKIFLLLVLFLFPLFICAQYRASLISDSLKKDAFCVKMEDNVEMIVESENSYTLAIKEVFTVLSKEGENSALLEVYYDKNSSVKIGQISIYNSTGEKVKKIKSSDIVDLPAFANYSLFSEQRVKLYLPNYRDYPYTIEYNYEVKRQNAISFGSWRPISEYYMSLQHGVFAMKVPRQIKVNTKSFKINPSKESIDKEFITRTWTIENFSAIDEEAYDPGLIERIPVLYIMPEVLVYDNYKGVAKDWQTYGSWAYNLYLGKDLLSDAEKSKLTSLTGNIKDTLELIRFLYKYMQDNTRYVNITLGLGGYQPFDARTVFETGYGDCKALTNYLHALLKYYSIKSYPALVISGRKIVPIIHDFPNFAQFNHMILCVPFHKDTIWLECTDQLIPFGFLGDFTDNREVLLLTEKGGIFGHTRQYTAKDNIRSCHAEINLDATGSAKLKINTYYKGLEYYNIIQLLRINYDEQKKLLYKNMYLPSANIENFNIWEDKQSLPIACVKEDITSTNFATFSGKYMIMQLNLLNFQGMMKKMLSKRQSDLLIYRTSTQYDTLIYTIPAEYKLESLPEGKDLKSEFGEYRFTVSANENKVIYTRNFMIKEGRYVPSAYEHFYDFILKVSKYDNSKLMLTKY